MKMCRALLSCLLTGFLLAPLSFAFDLEKVAPAEVGMSSERLARLTTTMTAYVDEGRLPGAVVLVARKGRIVYFEAFGNQDRDSGSKMTTGSIFRIASQTKALISVAIMMLQEEGSLLISDELSKYLPAFVATKVAVTLEGGEYELVPAKRPITLRDLLTHTSGISYGNGPAAELWREAGIQGWYFANRDEPIQVTVNRMASLPFDSQPGERFVYGYSTDILGAVVEVVSGLPLDVFLRERILEPLAMADSHFYLPESKRGRLTTVYSVGAEGLKRAPDPGGMVGQGAYVDGPRKSFSGGAGFLSTARDYGRFLQMLLNGGILDDKRLLAPSTVRLMTVNHIGERFAWDRGTGFGLGFSVLEDVGLRGSVGSVGEYGWGGAYHSSYWVDPAQELVVVYLTQVIPAAGLDDHAKLRALIYAAIID